VSASVDMSARLGRRDVPAGALDSDSSRCGELVFRETLTLDLRLHDEALGR
jgi:hypothetical protein